jgi:hypothetical protein
VSVAGGGAEDVGGFVDVFVEHQRVAQLHLAVPITAYKGAVESISGVAGSVDGVPGLIQ